MKKTRIAPSPTGMFHIGTARTAYFNWLAAKASGGEFILRIDDTDTDRNNEAHVDVILSSLDWLGLDYFKLYRQSDRLELYKEKANFLIDAGVAVTKDDAVVLNWTGDVPEIWNDGVVGDVKVSRQENELARQFVLLRADGMPTYNFATVVDEIDLNITDVIRGSDHISNTVKQIVLRNLLEGPTYNFHHIGLIHKDGKKMSKRDASVTDLKAYQDAGYTAEMILSYLVKLGWNVSDPNIDKAHPIITKDIALQLFASGKMRSAPSNFDQTKLDWIKKKMSKA